MNAIELENVVFSYRKEGEENRDIFEQPAVNGVSFSVEEGEFVALVGHNGSGKSTIARLLNGLLQPQNGRVLVFGESTAEEKKLFEIRKNLGVVFQNPDNQMVATIVEDDIAFGPENVGLPREEIVKRVDFALHAVGMEEFRETAGQRLSGGQKQRIAIAGVLALMPKVMVLDESTAMLDPKGRKEVLEVIRRLNKEFHITVVHITHFMEEAAEADRIIVLNSGKLELDGTPREVFANYEKLREIGLDVPVAKTLEVLLAARGVEVGDCIFHEELVEKLCRLKSNT